jgi:hypothetical protein
MPDLSAYLDFTVTLDKSGVTPAFLLTDTSTYPGGVPATVTGIVYVKQPDGLSVTGDFLTPDVTWTGSALTVASKELRLSDNNTLQNGLYTVTYTVKATGYTDTLLTKTFTVSYVAPAVTIVDLIDVFTPALQQLDGTQYNQAGFGAATITRAWSADIVYVGSVVQTVTGTSTMFDMAYAGDYYDAHYDVTLTSTWYFTMTDATWVTIQDGAVATNQVEAYTPPTLAQLVTSLKTMKAEVEAGTYCGGCGCGCGVDYTPYNTAQNIYDLIVQRGKNGDVTGLDEQVQQLQKMFDCSGILDQDHTYEAIPPYSWTEAAGSVQAPIQFTVASGGVYAPAGGDTSYINPTLVGQINFTVYRQAIADYLVYPTDFTYRGAGGFDLTTTTFVAGERFTLIFY